MSVPIKGSWWVRPGVFLAGGYPGGRDAAAARRRLEALVDAGIRAVVCLQPLEETNTDGQPFAPYEPLLRELAATAGATVSCFRHPIPDNGVPTASEMAAILDAIDASIAVSPVYVHCWGGHGRTGTVVGCWLVRHGHRGDEALAAMESFRRHDPYLRANPAPQTEAQRQFVCDWLRSDPSRP